MFGLFGKKAGEGSPEEQLLRSTGLFDKLGADELKTAASQLVAVMLTDGQRVFAEGDTGDAFYLLRSGAVRIVTQGDDDQEIVLARIEPGQYFGEQALLAETPGKRSASAHAVGDTELLRLSHSDFRRLLDSSRKLEDTLRESGRQQFVEKWTRQRSVFGELDTKLLESLSRNVREFTDGAVIFKQGDASDGVYFITDGAVRIVLDEGAGTPPREARMVAGQMFGELGIVREAKRAGTALAQGAVRTLFFDKKQFRKLYDSKPELEAWVRDVQSIYEVPNRGLVTIHEGEHLGMDCVTSLFQLQDGRSVSASKVRGQEIFVLAEAGAPQARTLAWQKDAMRRELSLADGRIVAMLSEGYWGDLSAACSMALDGAPFEEWRESLFRSSGSVQLKEPDETSGDPNALLCNCMRIPRGKVRAAIDGGCVELEAVSKTTGAGSVCGGCRPKISAMLGNTSWEPVRVSRIIERSAGVRSYQLQPYSGNVQPYEPGQHIVIQSLIDERFISRTYTLTSEPGSADHYEITVKREEQGYFSNWLFNQAADKPFLRVAAPGGNGVHSFFGRDAIVCLVAGIGVTPAIALVRHLAVSGKAQRVHVDYSASTAEEQVFVDELQAAAAKCPQLNLNLRVTARDGRLSAAQIGELVAKYPGAGFFVCGSQAYQSAVRETLAASGVTADAILSEEFTHAGAH